MIRWRFDNKETEKEIEREVKTEGKAEMRGGRVGVHAIDIRQREI